MRYSHPYACGVDLAMSGLPVLDFRQFEGPPTERAAFLLALGNAARDVGFFYLVGHGIDDALTNSIVDASRRFFTLSERDKLSIEMVNSPHFRGYTRPGWERTRGRPDWREQIDIG